MQNLIQFGTDSMTVTKATRGHGTSVRLMSAKEFKRAKGLKGNAASRAYNDYIREQGKASTGELARAMSTGELLVKGYIDSARSLRVSFVKKSSIRDKAAVEKPNDVKAWADGLKGLEAGKLAEVLKALGVELPVAQPVIEIAAAVAA